MNVASRDSSIVNYKKKESDQTLHYVNQTIHEAIPFHSIIKKRDWEDREIPLGKIKTVKKAEK